MVRVRKQALGGVNSDLTATHKAQKPAGGSSQPDLLRAEAIAIFTKADFNQNGTLSRTEIKKEIQKDGALRQKLSAKKWKRFFKELDANGDGVVTMDEWITYYKATAVKWKISAPLQIADASSKENQQVTAQKSVKHGAVHMLEQAAHKSKDADLRQILQQTVQELTEELQAEPQVIVDEPEVLVDEAARMAAEDAAALEAAVLETDFLKATVLKAAKRQAAQINAAIARAVKEEEEEMQTAVRETTRLQMNVLHAAKQQLQAVREEAAVLRQTRQGWAYSLCVAAAGFVIDLDSVNDDECPWLVDFDC